jgi:HYR domain
MSWKHACAVHCAEWQHHCHALSCLLRRAWHPSAYFHAEVSKAPVIACPASMTLTEGDTVTIGSGPISATDPNAGDSAKVACTSSGSPVGDVAGLAVGSHTVTCTATDMKGLSNSCDIAVTVEPGALAILKSCLHSACIHATPRSFHKVPLQKHTWSNTNASARRISAKPQIHQRF